jgi:hypothetical protein
MAYTVKNYQTKKALAQDVKVQDVEVQRFTNGSPFETKPGQECIEGPHYPQPHKFYACVTIVEKNDMLVIPQGSTVK